MKKLTSLQYQVKYLRTREMIIDEITELGKRISHRLDEAIEAEKQFNIDIRFEFVKYQREINKIMDEMKAIKDRFC